MIIEYFGLPGSGKTFEMSKDYDACSSSKFNLTKLYFSFYGKFYRKFIFFINIFNKKSKKIYETIKNIYLNNNYIENNQKRKFFADLTFKLYFYNRFKNKTVFIDEGVVQSIVFFDKKMENKTLKKILDLIDTDIKFVYIDLDIYKCIKNIQSRNRHICEFDEIKGDKLREVLNEKKYIFDDIYNTFYKTYLIERR